MGLLDMNMNVTISISTKFSILSVSFLLRLPNIHCKYSFVNFLSNDFANDEQTEFFPITKKHLRHAQAFNGFLYRLSVEDHLFDFMYMYHISSRRFWFGFALLLVLCHGGSNFGKILTKYLNLVLGSSGLVVPTILCLTWRSDLAIINKLSEELSSVKKFLFTVFALQSLHFHKQQTKL
uniref:Uncharacterized protein n=1 Tax=Glossina austeni TaxID=7395 RepID=A0A1A9UEB3_GLOAU